MENSWEKRIEKHLLNQKIVKIKYMFTRSTTCIHRSTTSRIKISTEGLDLNK